MAFDRHGNLLPFDGGGGGGGATATRSGARSRSRGRTRGRPRPSSSGPPSSGQPREHAGPTQRAGGGSSSPAEGSRSPRSTQQPRPPQSPHVENRGEASYLVSRSRGRTHSTGRKTARGFAALPFGLGGGDRDKDGGSGGGRGIARGKGESLSRRRLSNLSNGSFHSTSTRRPSELSTRRPSELSSESSVQDGTQPSRGPLHRNGSGQASNRPPPPNNHGGKATAANQSSGQSKMKNKIILVDEKDKQSYRRMADGGPPSRSEPAAGASGGGEMAVDDMLPPPRCMTEQPQPPQRPQQPPPGSSKVDEIVMAYKSLAVASKSVSNSTAESTTVCSDTTRSESESPRNLRPSISVARVTGSQAMPPPPPRGRPPPQRQGAGRNAAVTSPSFDRAVMYPPPPAKGNSFRSTATAPAKGGSFRSTATAPTRQSLHSLPSLPFAGDIRATRGFAKRPQSAQDALDILDVSESTKRRSAQQQQGEGDAAAGSGEGSGNKMLSPLAQSILAKSRRNFEEARAAVTSSSAGAAGATHSQQYSLETHESDNQSHHQVAGPLHRQPKSDAGGCPGYKIGDTLRDPSHMSAEQTEDALLAAVESLQNHDFCFLRRSDGTYTYSILAYRTMEPLRPSSPKGGGSPGEEECMTFVVSGTGCTKMIKRRQWTEFVRRCAVPPPAAAADSDEPPQPQGAAAGCAATTEALEKAAEAEDNLRRIRREFYATRRPDPGGWAPPASIEFGIGGDDDISVVSDVSYKIAQTQSAALHAQARGGFAPSQPVIME